MIDVTLFESLPHIELPTSEVLSLVSIAVVIILTVAGWYIARKTRPSEQASLDFQALTEYRDSLEKQVETLESDREHLEQKLEQNNIEREKILGDLATCQESVKIIPDHQNRIAELEGLLKSNADKTRSLEDRLLESRLIAAILTEQRNQIAQRFGIPMSVAEKIEQNGH